MKKILYSFLLITLSLIVLIIVYLSTIGLETSKLNNLIIQEVKKQDPNLQISLDKIKIKFDIKKIQIYLTVQKPKIVYQDIEIAIKEIDIYSKISSILGSKNKINQAIISIENIKTEDFQKIAVRIKPSNFKTYLLNNLSNGEFKKILIDIKLNEDLKIIDYKVNGSVKKIDIKISNNFKIKDVNLNFISDKQLTLINSIDANYQGISISNSSLSIKKNKEFEIKGIFNSKFNLDKDKINKLLLKSSLNFFKKNQINIDGSILHNFTLKIDENFKLIDYDYTSNGKILESKLILKNSLKNNFIEKPIKKILISKTNLEINLNKKDKNNLKLDGLYNLGGSENKKFKIIYDLKKKKF